MTGASSLRALADRPFELLVELERRARAAIAAREGAPAAADEWVGIGFRLGAERFVTPALKEYEERVLSAADRIEARERELFETLRRSAGARRPQIHAASA